MLPTDVAIKKVEELIALEVQAVEKLSKLHTSLVRRQQQELFGEPALPQVVSGSSLRRLRADIEAAKKNGAEFVVFQKQTLTIPYAELVAAEYKI